MNDFQNSGTVLRSLPYGSVENAFLLFHFDSINKSFWLINKEKEINCSFSEIKSIIWSTKMNQFCLVKANAIIEYNADFEIINEGYFSPFIEFEGNTLNSAIVTSACGKITEINGEKNILLVKVGGLKLKVLTNKKINAEIGTFIRLGEITVCEKIFM